MVKRIIVCCVLSLFLVLSSCTVTSYGDDMGDISSSIGNPIVSEYDGRDDTEEISVKNIEEDKNTVQESPTISENEDFNEENVSNSNSDLTNEQDLEWLEFSFTDYHEARCVVEYILAEELTSIEEAYGDKEFPIAIYLKDINGDGRDDIIALLFHQFYHGSHANCRIYAVLNYSENIKGLRIAQAFVIFDDEGNQNSLSVQSSKESSWLEFVSHVNGVVWSWNGERYEGRTFESNG